MTSPLELFTTIIPYGSKEFIDATKGMFIIDHSPTVVISSDNPPKMHIPVSDIDVVDFIMKENRHTCETVSIVGNNRNIIDHVQGLNIPYKMHALVAPRGKGYIVHSLHLAVYSREDAELISESFYEKSGVRIFGYVENTHRNVHMHDERIMSGKLCISDDAYTEGSGMDKPYIKCINNNEDDIQTLRAKINAVSSMVGDEFTVSLLVQGKMVYDREILHDLNDFEELQYSLGPIQFTAVCIQLDDSMAIDSINIAVNKLKLSGLFDGVYDHKDVASPFVLDIQL